VSAVIDSPTDPMRNVDSTSHARHFWGLGAVFDHPRQNFYRKDLAEPRYTRDPDTVVSHGSYGSRHVGAVSYFILRIVVPRKVVTIKMPSSFGRHTY